MKNNLNRFVLLSFSLFVALSWQSCQDDDEGELGEPYGKTEGLVATAWVISEVYLVDEGNPSKPEFNISNFYTSGEDRLEVNFDASGTFTVNPGQGLNFFPESGTWSFNDPNYPTEIILQGENEIFVAPLGGPTRIVDEQLKLNIVKRSCIDGVDEKPALGYRLIFNRKP